MPNNSVRVIHFRAALGRLNAAVACLLAMTGASACQDAGGDPTALLMSADPVSASAELPSLPALAAEGGVEHRLSGPIDRWRDSWSSASEEGSMRRATAHAEAAGLLAEGLGRAGVEGALARLQAALRSTDRLRGIELPDAIGRTLTEAHREAATAGRALVKGAPTEAVVAVLRGADLLRGIDPALVAHVVVAHAEDGLRTAEGRGIEREAVERGERLLHGARAAVEAGNPSLAIRRAYYACQLLGVAVLR